MIISIKKGYKKGYPVYNSFEEKIPSNNIEYKQRHYIVKTKDHVNYDYYDVNGQGFYDKLYCKIPFVLSNFFAYLLLVITWSLLYMSIIYSTSKVELIPYITILCVNAFTILLWLFYKETKLQEYINKSKIS